MSNQHYFESDGEKEHTFYSFVKISAGGKWSYILSFSGTIDGSFRRISFANDPCDDWSIVSLSVGRIKSFPSVNYSEIDSLSSFTPIEFTPLTFNGGSRSKKAELGVFSTDPAILDFDKGDYMVIRICCKGKKIPCHPETLVPIYEVSGDKIRYNVFAPLPVFVGCDRPTKGKIGYFGDSITQGCGTTINGYAHWNAHIAEKIGEGYSHYNLGIGYGKAKDAATLGVWTERAKSVDTVFLCFGVNDLNADRTAEDIFADLSLVIRELKNAGCRMIVQTPPPFDYPPERAREFVKLSDKIMSELIDSVELVYDVREVLSVSESEPHMAKHGTHPNDEGCLIWANALYPRISELF